MTEGRATGVGGVFFRARDPEALKAWYREHLGLPGGGEDPIAFQGEGGMLIFGIFREETEHFPREQQWMVNLRVNDLDGVIARLAAAGVEPYRREDEEGVGRFAWVVDPEGNHLELWEPLAGL